MTPKKTPSTAMTATAVQRFDGFEPSQRDALKKDDNVPLMSMLVEECAQASKRPAEVVYDFRQNQFKNTTEALPLSLLTETSPAMREGIEDAFVIPNVLNAEECHELIHRAETSGILPPYKVLRTAKRTEKYQDRGSPQTEAAPRAVPAYLESMLMVRRNWQESTISIFSRQGNRIAIALRICESPTEVCIV